MDYVDVHDVRLRVNDVGEGTPAVILLHGGYENYRVFDSNLAQLAPQRRVIAYDRRGCGESTGPKDPEIHTIWADDLVAVMDALDLPEAVVAGVSFGAMTALDAAIRYPDRVRGAVLIAGTAREFVPSPGWNVHFPDRRNELASMTVPTLVLHGSADEVFPPDHGHDMAEGIPGAQLQVFDGGHDIHTEFPTEIRAAVNDFVGQL